MTNTQGSDKALVDQPWALSEDDILEALDVDPQQGLSGKEVETRRERYGSNRLREVETRSAWSILASQFKSMVIWLLAAATLVSFAFGEWIEGSAIAIVIVINAVIGFVTELRAVRSMEALQELGRVNATVQRDGQALEVDAEELVPGDIVILEGGDVVTADLRLIEANTVQANESTLTGESTPVSKSTELLDETVALADRTNMVFKGTAITRGSGQGVVVSIGMDTELGNISSLVEEAEQEATPLEERLDRLGSRLVWATLVVAVIVAGIGLLRNRDLLLIITTAIALAVATVPEGLPIVATIALARGMWRMAERNGLIRKLSAVETLGATNVICADKTGTLTENRMTVVTIELPQSTLNVTGEGLDTEGEFLRDDEPVSLDEMPLLEDLLHVAVLCNNASLPASQDGDDEAVGEPMEVALLVAGAKAGIQRDALLDDQPEMREEAFDPEIKMMATFHEADSGFQVAVKGAPEAVLEVSSRMRTPDGDSALDDEHRQRWLEQDNEMAAEGLRVIALATKTVDGEEADPYADLTFLGLVGLLDPPRKEVQPAIESCQQAGIRVVMITGDHPGTAKRVALAVGLVGDEDVEPLLGSDISPLEDLTEEKRERLREANILARVNPEQKLTLVSLYQEAGSIVAMTGDGVNDAPALKKADIGVAMGQRGSQVAHEAAEMILQDDAFDTIVAAVHQGRVIFGNIRKFVYYLLSCNVSEIMLVTLASLLGAPLPIRPLQILFLNLVTDVFPALALGVGEGDPHIMEKPPRDPSEAILTPAHWRGVVGYGALLTAAVWAALWVALSRLGYEETRAVTISFLTLAFAQLWHVFNMRDKDSGFLRNDIVRNVWVWGALALCTLLLLAAGYAPGISDVLETVPLSLTDWGIVMGASLAPVVVGQGLKVLGVGAS
jgi:P-type Ca2+ transporter type 2C